MDRRVRHIGMPFDCGRRGPGLARGPELILDGVDGVTWIGEPTSRYEAARVFEINRGLAGLVGGACRRGELPIVVSANCNACLGVIGGLGELAVDGVGVVWLDAHGDLNTPDTTESGFMDGMAFAALTGACWRSLAATVPGFRPVAEEAAALVGVRDLDDAESVRLAGSAIAVVDGARIARDGITATLPPVLDRIARACEVAYLHVDLDVLDPSVAPMNEYAVPGGLSLAELDEVIGMVASSLPLAAAVVSAYNPEIDVDRAGLEAARTVVRAVARAGSEVARTKVSSS